MSAHRSVSIDGTLISDTDGTVNTSPVAIEENSEEYLLVITSTGWLTDISVALVLQHSPDGTNWFTAPTPALTAVASNTVSHYPCAISLFKNIRLNMIETATAGSVTIAVDLYYKRDERI